MPEPIQTPVPAADELAAQVLLLAQSRLTADLRFLSSALEQLKPIPVPALDTLFAGDGHRLYYCPETLLRTFRAQQSVPTRALLHVTLHFLWKLALVECRQNGRIVSAKAVWSQRAALPFFYFPKTGE